MTANLDGETSLKTRHSASLTKQARDMEELVSMSGCIECENPNQKLDSFLGRLSMWTCREGEEPKVLIRLFFKSRSLTLYYDISNKI